MNAPHEELDGGTLTVGAGSFDVFSWTRTGGTALLDLTSPASPVTVAAGVYVISVNTGLDPAPVPASANPVRVWTGSPTTFAPDSGFLQGGAVGGPGTLVSCWAGFLAAAQAIPVQLSNDDATTTYTYTASMSLVKLAAT